MRRITPLIIFLIIQTLAIDYASSAVLILDNTNDQEVFVEPGASIRRNRFDSGPIFGANLEFAFGASDVAVFPGATQLGGNVDFGPYTSSVPMSLVNNFDVITVLATATGNKYEGSLTYFFSLDQGPVGIAPSPNNNAGAVFDLTFVPVPEPSTGWLVLSGLCLAIVERRRQR